MHVCVCTCVCVYMCVRVYMCVCACTCVRACASVCVCGRERVCACIHVCMQHSCELHGYAVAMYTFPPPPTHSVQFTKQMYAFPRNSPNSSLPHPITSLPSSQEGDMCLNDDNTVCHTNSPLPMFPPPLMISSSQEALLR